MKAESVNIGGKVYVIRRAGDEGASAELLRRLVCAKGKIPWVEHWTKAGDVEVGQVKLFTVRP